MAAYPSYLLRSRHSVFYFRIAIPDALKPLFSRREIRRSLQTRCQREALIRSREMLFQVQQMFTQAFQGVRPSLASLRCAWELEGKRAASWASWLRQQQLVGMAAAGVGSLNLPRADSEAEQGGAAPQRKRKVSGSALEATGLGLLPDAPSVSPRFSQVVNECLEQQKRERVAAKTMDDKRAVAGLLIRVIGDLPIDLISRQDARKFRETALKLPPRINQLPAGQSLQQVIETATSTISLTTFNNYVKNLTTFFSYAIREGYCQRNPFDGLRVKQRGKVSEERSVFTEDDLRRLFSRASYAPADTSKPHQYWLPLLGLYTGARLTELCQLYLDDVVSIGGVDCLYIRASRPDQKLKTASSERLVPIHSKLKGLGFLEFMNLFTARDMRRMLGVEFVSELLLRLVAGITNKKDLLEEVYAANEEEFPNESSYEAEFTTAMALIWSIYDESNKVIFKSRGNFSSLFGCFVEYYRRTGRRTFQNPERVKGILSDFLVAVRERAFTDEQPKIEEYQDAVARASSDRVRRYRREQIIGDLLIEAGEIENKLFS